MKNTYLHIGGLVAVGFDASEQYLLTVSHSGRGVFRTIDWARVARDTTLAYPENGVAIGIGPIEGVNIAVAELDSEHDLSFTSRSGKITLHCESSGISVATPAAEP